MDNYGKDRLNRFEKHPIRTIVLFILISFFTCDFLAANIYKLINGYSWNDSLWFKNKVEKRYRIKSDIYHHDLAKNKEIKNARYRNFEYKVYTNSLGFKDKMVRDVPFSADRYRIIFIGDSFTEGVGLNYEDTFVGRIDEELSKKGIEVFNAAVCSYSPTIYWRKIKYLIEDVGLKFNELVVFMDMSDVPDEALYYCLDEDGNVASRDSAEYLERVSGIENGGTASYVKRILGNLKLAMKDNSILTYFAFMNLRIRLNVFKHQEFAIQTAWSLNKNIYTRFGEKGLKKGALYMDKLNSLLKAHNIKLTVAVYPWPQQVYCNDVDSIQELYWRNWCEKNGVPFIDYFPYFSVGKTAKERNYTINKYYMEGDCHCNKEGHKLIADIFLDFYTSRPKTAPLRARISCGRLSITI